jgi:hypothetical protein
MGNIPNPTSLKRMLAQHGVSKTAKILGVRHATVRQAARDCGFEVARGRPRVADLARRDAQIRRLRESASAAQLAERFGLSVGRVHQICRRPDESVSIPRESPDLLPS